MIWRVVTAGLLVAALMVALEVVLLRLSRYRLTHGDGRERAFRGRRPQEPPSGAGSPAAPRS
jgi:hypothetical protein